MWFRKPSEINSSFGSSLIEGLFIFCSENSMTIVLSENKYAEIIGILNFHLSMKSFCAHSKIKVSGANLVQT